MKKSSPSVNGTRRLNHETHGAHEKTALQGMSGEERLPRRSGGSEVAPACGVRWPEPALFGKQEPGAAYAHSSEGPSGEPKAVPRGTALHTLREYSTTLPLHLAASIRSPWNSVMSEEIDMGDNRLRLRGADVRTAPLPELPGRAPRVAAHALFLCGSCISWWPQLPGHGLRLKGPRDVSKARGVEGYSLKSPIRYWISASTSAASLTVCAISSRRRSPKRCRSRCTVTFSASGVMPSLAPSCA